MVNWEGIFSTADQGVRSLELYGSMRDGETLTLNGTVPAGLGSLPNLRFLKMWRLGLTGSIPAELGNLSNLEELRLDQNALTGSIPTGLGSLGKLRYMSLSINQLSGGVPSDLGNLSQVEYLNLDRNFLGLETHPTAGSPAPNAVQNPIPASLGNLTNLRGLVLGDNNFAGSIPAALGNLTGLYLNANDFTGSIPAALGSLPKLEVLTASGNQLSGSIPSQLGNLAALEFLDLSRNGLQNSIPAQLGRLSKLEYLHLAENDLSGPIPSALGDLAQLTQMFLDTNRLNGAIPADLGDLAQLRELNLARNELSGAIPSELGDLENLESLNLNDNGLSLDIPSELGDLQTVDYISLSCNFLTGNIPSELGDIGNQKPVDPGKLAILLLDRNKLNIEAADVPASLDNIGFVRLTSGNQCPRGQPDADPPSTDEVPPTFEMAELSRDGLTIVLTYNESLDSSNGPATTDFTVKVDGQAVTVSTVDVLIREVRLALGGAVTEHQGVTVAYTDPTSGDDEEAIQDRSGNDAADLTERTVTNESTVGDDVAPNFESVALSSDGNTITLTYDEILDSESGPGTTNFQVVVEGEPRAVSRVSVNDRQVALRLSSPVTVSQTASVSYFDPTTGDDANAIQDRSGNDAATLENEPVPNDSQAQDTRAPRFERAVMSSNGLSITLVYDEVLDDQNGPAASDFTAEVDGESADLSSNSPVTLSGRTVALRLATAVRELQDVTVTYTDPTGDDDTNAIQDAAGNDAADLIDHKVTNASTVLDQVAPLFQSVAMSTDGATITLTYDEILDGGNGPATANFQIMVQGEWRGVSTATVNGKTVELRLASAITTGQTVTVTYNDPTVGIDDLNAIQDRAGNDAASLIDEGVENTSEVTDSTAPKFVRAVMASNGLSITLTYDEVLDGGNGPGTTDFTVKVDDVSAEPSQVSLSGRTVLLGLGTGVQSLQDVSVGYTDPTGDDDANAIQDAAGNDAVSLVDQGVANASTVLDEIAPVFLSATTSGDGTKIILTYDEILDSANKPATANFEITVQGEARGASTVTVIGKTVELGLGIAVTTGQVVTVAYTDPTDGVDDTNAIQDRAGNDAATLTAQDVSNDSGTADSTAPTFVRAVLASDGWTLTLTYDEVLDDQNEPATTDFAVTVDGDSQTISTVDVRDREVLLFLGGLAPSLKDVKLTYTDPSANDDANAIQDPAGNDAVSLTDQEVTNASTVLDERAPEFEDATTSTDGTKIILTYDEVLDSENEPAAGNFEIRVQDEPRDVSTVTVSGKTVELGLGTAITIGQDVRVSYSDPTYGVDDTNAIQDRAGNDATDLFQRDVTNASTVADTRAPRFDRAAMSSNGGTLTLTYDEVLDEVNRPLTSAFGVTVAGQAADVSSVDVIGRAVLVNLVSAVTAGQDVRVTYTDPSTDNDANAIQDPAGNDAVTLTNQSVANSSTVPDERAPLYQSAEVSSDGLTLTLTYDENLDSGNGPAPADFVVSVEGERRQVSTVTVSGTDVALRMASVITSFLNVAVTYTDPRVGVDDTKAIQDAAGNDAASLSWPVVNGSVVEDTTPPGFVRAVVSSDGGTITLTYDEVLDAAGGPLDSAFTVKVDGQSVTLSVASTGAVRGRTVVVGLATVVRTGQDVTVTYTDPTAGDDDRAIQDPAGNDAATLTDQMVTNASTVPDERAPEFVSASTSIDGLTITLTFDEDLDSQNGPRTANFGLTVQGERRDVSTVNVSGKTVTLGLGGAITTEQAVAVIYADPTADVDDRNAIQDEAGNDAASLSETVTNASTVADTTAPTFVRAVLSSDGGMIVLTYDEVLDDENTPTTSDFEVTVDEQSAALSSNSPVTVQGRTVALGLDSAVTADQDVSVTYTDPSANNDGNAIQDPAGNDAASLTGQTVTNASAVPDERAPKFLIAATTSDGLMIVLTFDEDLDGQHGPRTSDFGVTVQGERQAASTVTVSGKTVTLELGTAITTGETVAVIYTDPTAGVDDRNAIQDSVGNDAASLTKSVTNNSTVADTEAPTLERAETSSDGGRIVLTFSEVLDSTKGPQGSDFTVTVDEASADLSLTSPVTVRGRTVVLGLETAVTADQDITVTYTDPTANDDANAIQDTVGNDVATLADQSVANRVGQRPRPPSTPGSPHTPPSGSTPSGSTPSSTPPSSALSWLDVTLTVPEGPAEVGQTLTYTVTASNTGAQGLTGVTWRDVTSGTAAQSLGNLAAGASTTATGSFGPLDDSHIPHIILTVAVDSDQTDERLVSLQVEVVAATSESSTSQTSSVELSGERQVTGPQPRVPSSLQLRVVRVLYEVPDVHLAHNIPDLLLTLPDGSETTCNFLTHYESTGGLARWGYTTSEVVEERPGSLTQYYQRGVVDCHEREGSWLMERRLAWDHFGGGVDGSEDLGVEPHLLSDQPGQLLGPWSHRVSDYAVDGTYTGFLNFFTALGGVPSFGYPKSDARYDNDPRRQLGIAAATEGFVRQYFQAAVMEFHPNTLAPVMLRLLGDDLRDRRYPGESYKWYSSFASVAPLRVGQIYVAEYVAASPVTAPPLGPPVTAPPTPGVPAQPSALSVRVDRVLFSEPDVHLAHNIPDLVLTQTDGAEARCDFLSYYEATQGLARWGHAISEVLEEYPGTLSQYYQRGVVDCHNREGAWLIERRLVWDYIGGGAEGAPDLGVEPNLLSDQPGDLWGPWGHRVSDYAVDGTYVGFLDFFTALGGVNTFGNPKTEARYDDDPRAELGIAGAPSGVIRQYFQAAVLEYHPDDELQPVKLYLLGHDVRDRLYPNQTYTIIASFGPAAPLSEGQIYTPERVRLAAAVAPLPSGPSTTPPVIPPATPRLGLRVGRVLFSAPDRHLSHNIPDLTMTLADGSEAQCDFLSYYEATHGLARWGHAISEVLEEQPGILTQYYQRGVVDCHQRYGGWTLERRLAWDYIGGGVEGAPDLGVEPNLLSDQPGELLGPWGHRVSDYAVDGTYVGFLEFFTALGGVETFGHPKTEARYDHEPWAVLHVPDGDPGIIRQYFQAAVLEYHPSDAFQPVKLFLLGDVLRDRRYPAHRAFVAFGPYGPLTPGQTYYPVATSNVIRPAG